MAENKVNKPQQEKEKSNKKGFGAWWKGLKTLQKGLIIGGGVAVIATSITLPIVLTRKKAPAGTEVNDTEWRAAWSNFYETETRNFSFKYKRTITNPGGEKIYNSAQLYEEGNKEKASFEYGEETTTMYTKKISEGTYKQKKNGAEWKDASCFEVTEMLGEKVLYVDKLKESFTDFTYKDGTYTGTGTFEPGATTTRNMTIKFNKDKKISYFAHTYDLNNLNYLETFEFENYGSIVISDFPSEA